MYLGHRDAFNGVPSTRNAMMVEEHWRVLKNNCLLLHNRPRIDFVTYIIYTQLIPKHIQDYSLYLDRLKKEEGCIFSLNNGENLHYCLLTQSTIHRTMNGGATVQHSKLITVKFVSICGMVGDALYIVR